MTVVDQPGVDVVDQLGREDAGVPVPRQVLAPVAEDAIRGATPPVRGVFDGAREGQRVGAVLGDPHSPVDGPRHGGVVLPVGTVVDRCLSAGIAALLGAAVVQRFARLAEGVRELDERQAAPGSVVGLGDHRQVVAGADQRVAGREGHVVAVHQPRGCCTSNATRRDAQIDTSGASVFARSNENSKRLISL
jgi:hypothetical protein